MAAGLEKSEDDIQSWLESHFFKPYWDEYKTHILVPSRLEAEEQGKQLPTGLDVGLTFGRLKDGEEDGKYKYSVQIPMIR